MNPDFKESLLNLINAANSELDSYSSTYKVYNIEAAMVLIHQARQLGCWCCINIQSDYHYQWYVEFVKENTTNSTGLVFIATADEVKESGKSEHGTSHKSFNECLLLATCYALKASIAHILEND